MTRSLALRPLVGELYGEVVCSSLVRESIGASKMGDNECKCFETVGDGVQCIFVKHRRGVLRPMCSHPDAKTLAAEEAVDVAVTAL